MFHNANKLNNPSPSRQPPWPDAPAAQRTRSVPQQGEPREAEPVQPAAKQLPAISVPKGGGAVRGIDEKFEANAATGTSSLTIPLPVSPGRSGFQPQLALAYNSGGGNGPFGLGWNLSVPAITRKTDRGLPRYRDEIESDVFVLSGAEDLVPELIDNGGTWQRHSDERIIDGVTYRVQRYRPRIEGLFARIEKWMRLSGHTESIGEVHWRATTKDNITSIYGRRAESRIADPEDPGRVFSWLLEETFDDKGNVIVYEYKAENAEGIDANKPQEGKRLRAGKSFAQKYLKRVKYGNRVPFQRDDWLFELVLDYGEHEATAPTPAESQPWPVRRDAFSSYRAGFEIRTYRLCRRVLMFHRFDELGPEPVLVRSLDFGFEEHDHLTYLLSATQKGYVKDQTTGGYRSKALPALEFDYTRFQLDQTVHDVDTESLENLPVGIDNGGYQWIDIDGEGLSGVLTQKGNAWYFKRNLGAGADNRLRLAPYERLTSHPAHVALQSPRTQIMDIDGNGRKELVLLDDPVTGFFEKNHDNGWDAFVPFQDEPNIDWNDPNLRMIDLTGDGHADILITNDNVFLYYASKTDAGFAPPEAVRKALDEEQGPALVFADASQSIFLADMSGDGLTDIVRIRNSEVYYWPNLGYGRFGAKIIMDNPPVFDHPDRFNPGRIRLADIDGSGTTDILYLNAEAIRIYLNQSGNAWSDAIELEHFPQVDNLASVSVTDLLGNGTACLVWSSPLSRDARRPMRYIDLMGGVKPHLLNFSTNNMGRETRLRYAPSTKFYLADRAAGKPWITKLPFPVHVVEQVQVRDLVTNTRLVTTYTYHHGFFDGVEREFRGFGYVEQRDTESFAAYNGKGLFTNPPQAVDEEFFQPPVVTRTWFHTGAYRLQGRISRQFEEEYYQGDPEAVLLPDTLLPEGLTPEEAREANRALKGRMLRQEVYAEDGTPESAHPYGVTEQNFKIVRVQPKADQRHGVFFAHSHESLSYQYERKPDDPRIAHQMVLEVDDFGNVLKSAAIAYPRRTPAYPEQGKTLVTYTENQVINKPVEIEWYRIGLPAETRMYEITGLPAPGSAVYSIEEIRTAISGAAEIPYEAQPTTGVQKRLVERQRTLYLKDDLSELLPLGDVESRALPGETYRLALTPGLLTGVFSGLISAGRVTESELTNILRDDGKYVDLDGDGHWWLPSGPLFFSPDPDNPDASFARAHFYLPQGARDPFGAKTRVKWDRYDLLAIQTEDAVQNVIRAENDYRVLQPRLITDTNDNRTAVAFDALGLLVGTAVMGKAGRDEGDSLDAFVADLDQSTIDAHLNDPLASPHAILQKATTRVVYDLTRLPIVVYTLARETHQADLAPGEQTKIQHRFLYTDGFGREVMTKIQAEPGPAPARDATGRLKCNENLVPTDLRWVGTGRTIYDNKGNAVKKYEPYFSPTHVFETEKELVECGVTPILRYDPLGRLIRTDQPDGTFSMMEFDAWQQTNFDENDTMLESLWYQDRGSPAPGTPEPADAEVRAAWLAARHANTPTVAHLDTLGRTFLTIADNGRASDGTSQQYETHVELDIEGQALAITDARGNRVMEYRVRKRNGAEQLFPAYDLAGQQLYQNSMDAGERWMLTNVAGNPIHQWDSRRHHTRQAYDALQRPTELWVVFEETGTEILAEKTKYGERQSEDKANNLRGQIYKIFDSAGVVTNATYDFNGNLLRSTRQLAREYKKTIDWSDSPVLESEIFITETAYDALDRPVQVKTPFTPDIAASTIRPVYNEANLLEQVHVKLRGAATETTFVANIDYNARGQRTKIEYGNGVTTEYRYDDRTFRLVRLTTTRTSDNKTLQDLQYTYDPVGNITEIRDHAQQTIYFNNRVVEPHGKYEYDALYRLTRATGREHIGQNGNDRPDLKPHYDFNDGTRRHLAHPHDGQKMQRYTQVYEYDPVGNILKLIHQAASGAYTRRYQYEASNNRLTSTSLPDDSGSGTLPVRYQYDAHGNMTRMPHLPEMEWNFKDQLQQVDLNGGGRVYFVYDAAGERIRKVHEHNGATVEERLYLGGFEIYRKRNGAGLKLERETLHIMDNQRRIALVETRTVENGRTLTNPAPVQRYQLGNHLGSACVEVDERGAVISYEEYHPFGTTAYQAGRSMAEVSLKRYRYTGKERDEETGLYYHGARYYAPWLGRWVSADPIGLNGGINFYSYVRNNLVRRSDPTGTQESNEPQVGFGLRLDFEGHLSVGPLYPPGLCDELNQACGPLLDVDLSGTEREYRTSVTLDESGSLIPARSARGIGEGVVSPSPEEERDFWSRGGSTLVGGGVLLGVGIALLAATSVGLFVGLVAAMALAGGIAGTTAGAIQLVRSYSGQTTSEQDREINEAASTAMMLSSPGSLVGGVVGVGVTGSEEGLRKGALAGGLLEAGITLFYRGGPMLLREAQFGIPRSPAWRSVRPAIQDVYGFGNAATRTRPNPAFPRAVERLELSHWIPQRWFRGTAGEWILNRPWNVTPMWAGEHALIDPARLRFIRPSWRAAYEAEQATGLPRQLRLMPPWLLQSGTAAARGFSLGFQYRLESK